MAVSCPNAKPASSRPSSSRRSSLWPWLHRDLSRGGRCWTGGHRPTRTRRRCNGRSGRSAHRGRRRWMGAFAGRHPNCRTRRWAGGRHEIRGAGLGYALDERHDGFLRHGVIPRRQRIGSLHDGRNQRQRANECGGGAVLCAGGFHFPGCGFQNLNGSAGFSPLHDPKFRSVLGALCLCIHSFVEAG